MSDVSQGSGWWQASNGKWYPPQDSDQAPAPGWWLASDGRWYPPVEREAAPAPGWWLASDGSWYPPEARPTKPTQRTQPARPAQAAQPAPAQSAQPPKPAASPAATAPRSPRNGASDPRVPAAAPASPEEQIWARNEQSRRDAEVLADARRRAATRALGSLQALIEQDKAERDAARTSAGEANGADPRPPAPTSGPAWATAGPGSAANERSADIAVPEPVPVRPISTEPPLLEVKQGTLAADIERIGERLAIFNDRVELHDRNDRVRQVIHGEDIADVVVSKKFTGSTVSVDSVSGESIVAKGLKPDQADEIRALILKRTRHARPVAPTAPAPTTSPAASPATSPARASAPGPMQTATPTSKATAAPRAESSAGPKPAPTVAVERATSAAARPDAAELIAKLVDLHRAGVLTRDELDEKTALVTRLARGERLASSSRTPA